MKTELAKKLKQLGVNGKEATNAWLATNAPNMSEQPSVAELQGLIDLADMELDLKAMQSSDADSLD